MVKQEPLKVVAVVLENNGCFLIGLRPHGKHHGGMWEFPGGKVHSRESVEDAAKREIREELGIELLETELTSASICDEEVCIQFLRAKHKGTPKPLEHAELQWCSVREILDLPLAPIDKEFVKQHLV